MNPQTYENSNGHYMIDNGHKIFFLCKKEADCKDSCNETSCTHTLYLERAKNGNILRAMFPHEFEKKFEKIYFNDHDYDWWEKEETDGTLND